MKHTFRKIMAWVLVICAMQVCFVPTVTAAGQSVTYDFYTPYKNYTYLFHWRVPGDGGMAADATKANSQIPLDYADGKNNWNLESNSGYGTIVKKTKLMGLIEVAGWVSINMGKTTQQVFRFKSPGTGNYNVDVNYYATNDTSANIRSEVMIIPAETGKVYSSTELSALLSKYRAQAEFSCYDANVEYEARKVTISCSFLENQEYFFVMSGGPRQADNSRDGLTFIRSLTANYAGEYDPPEDPEYARPVTLKEEALTRWEEGFPMVAEANGNDYLAIPIYGGKMYIFNMDTNQLVNSVNTGINVPRGATTDGKGAIYICGDGYHIVKYDLTTNKMSQSTNVNISGVSLGSLYDIHYGDDGNLYAGTDNGHVIRYNPNTDTVTAIHLKNYGIANPTYVSSVIQQGDYIYAAVTNLSKKHYLVKLTNAENSELVGTVEYTSTKPSTYMSYMSITEEGLILGTATNLMAVDTNTMTLLTAAEFGSDAQVQCYVSKEIDGKYYYVSSKDRYMYAYDPDAADDAKVVKKTHVGQFFDCQGATITLDRNGDGKDEQYLLAIENAKKYEITLVNPVTGDCAKVKLPIDDGAGASTGVNSLTNGPAGSNELYYGGFTSNQVIVYNTAEGRITGQITAAGIQTDALYVDGNTIYAGNYTEAQLTRLNRATNKPEVLFTLHNTLFDQSRIHSITGGDNKIFLGTFPYVYKHGGVLAWYDFSKELTYVAAGPNPSDVYYGKTYDAATGTSIDANAVVWYNEVSGEQVTTIENWTGVVENQGIKEVAYHNGILYAATSRAGGTNTSPVEGTSAKVIAYDVAARKVIATFDPTTQGFASPVYTISGIELDENGTLWCIVSETLFTLKLNADNTFTYSEKLSFDKAGYDLTQGRANNTILFKDGYVYAAFERIGGLCKINVANPSNHTLLLPNVTSNSQVPNSFAIGEDGNLYFLLGASLKMLSLDATEEEWTAADAVTAQIAAITETSAAEDIAAARRAYEALSLEEKSLVQNYSALLQVEADVLERQIAALGEITWEKREQVLSLIAVYQAMPKSQQNQVSNYYLLANANQTLLRIESGFPVMTENLAGEQAYFPTLEEAAAVAVEGKIILRENVEAGSVDLHPAVTLDLNGNIAVVEAISGKVMDSADGKGLIQTDIKSAALTSPDTQLILWDNTAGQTGYRVFNYQFLNMGQNANKDDHNETAKYGVVVKSFWSDLQFTNPLAYTLIASSNSGLNVGFEVSWTPNGGETTSKTFSFEAEIVEAWAEEEIGNADPSKNYCFYIRLTGFESLESAGVITVKPVANTVFNTMSATESVLDYTEGYDGVTAMGLRCEEGFGDLNEFGK